MPFGQQSGPPASASQMRELTTLLHEAGHTDFRDARGPMGFTQRQAGGKFTRDEAEAFIGRLRDAGSNGEHPTEPASTPPEEPALHHMRTDRLVAELRRRGWTVAKP
jgi:hypothetical protein